MRILQLPLAVILVSLICASPVSKNVFAGCLVPLVETELSAFTLGIGNALTTRQAFELMRVSSRARLEELRIAMAPFSDKEVKIMEKARLLPPFLVTRVKLRNLRAILKAGAVVSPDEAVRRSLVVEAPYTPGLEDELFGAHDCVFASLGQKAGREQYGEVVLRLRSDKLRSRAWGTFSSGFYFMTAVRVAEELNDYKPQFQDRLAFFHTVFSAYEWGELYPLMITAYLRSKPQEKRLAVQEELIAADSAEAFYDIVEARKVGYIEVKLDSYISLDDIELIEVPAAALPEVRTWPEAFIYLKHIESIGITDYKKK